MTERPIVRGLAAGGAVVLGLLGVALLVPAHDALVPRAGLLGPLTPLIVPVYGPALVAVGLAATAGASVLAWRCRGVQRLAGAAAVVCVVATAALAVPVGAVVTATVAAGGSVDPVRALLMPSPAPAGPDESPVYSTGPDALPLHLAIYRPAPATRAPRPILIYVHGGGWVSGSELVRATEMRRWADAGWLVVSVEYTLARDGAPTWDVAGPEVACAAARVAADAPAQGADPTRIVLLGDSAGGQLAVSVGYHAASGTQPSWCGGAVPTPRAVAVEYPAVDLADGYAGGSRSTYTGGSPDQVPERYRAVSGAAAVTAGAPPTLVIVPARDGTVPPGGPARFVHAARDVSVDARLVSIPYADHAFDQVDGSLGEQAAFSIVRRWADDQVGQR
ncbi:alpha/beta hydrolase [Actinomycetospora sp. CA-053990]|uniref:alpha/beta hydrolase n=1 Tax=Actinomycetospora sp. CA-053990 TaxID=3239891 RepID=UPI003D900EBE